MLLLPLLLLLLQPAALDLASLLSQAAFCFSKLLDAEGSAEKPQACQHPMQLNLLLSVWLDTVRWHWKEQLWQQQC